METEGSLPHSQKPAICPYSCVISGLRREVDKTCALLGYYTAYSVNSLPTFRDNILVPPSRIKKSKKSSILKYGTYR